MIKHLQELLEKAVDDLQRKDTFKVLCPNCLHKVLVNNLLENA